MTCEEFRTQLLQVDNPSKDEHPGLFEHYSTCRQCLIDPIVHCLCLDKLGEIPDSEYILPSSDPNSPFYALYDRPDQAFQMVRFSAGNGRNRQVHKAGRRERHSRFRPLE